MNKKLIAVAVAGVFALPFAAQADSSNVTIYGVVNASIDLTKTGNDAAGNQGASQTKVSSNQSRIGFKGTEDMGNGLSANFLIEQSLNVDGGAGLTGGNGMSSRNTYVGLAGKTWGEVRLGRQDTPYKVATRGLDNFADTLADNRNIFLGDARVNDAIAYLSPSMNGFMAAVAYVAGAEAAGSGDTKGDAWSMAGIYNNGPLFASLAYERAKVGTAGSGSITGTAAYVGKSAKAWKLGVGYSMDAFKVGFVYERATDDFVVHEDRNAWTLNGSYTMGANVLKAAYTKAGKIGNGDQTDAKQIAIGVDHNMSKRTSVYALYTKISNSDGIGYALGGYSTATTGGVTPTGDGADPSAWSFGIKHSF